MIIIFIPIVPDWLLVGNKKECTGSEEHKGYLSSIAKCAAKCKGVAPMFIFGTKDYGDDNLCHKNRCLCYCETSANSDGTCQQRDLKGFRLYKYPTQSKLIKV